MKKILLLSLILLASCSLDKIVQHHGVHNLEIKQSKLEINKSNINDILRLIGPPSTKNTFKNDLYIYMEIKTSPTRLTKLGKKKIIKNDVLVLEIDNRGVLLAKNFYNKDDINNLNFDENITGVNYSERSFIYNFLSSVRQKIDDPLNKKRIKN
jgi:outer membrane protein assembly factor BamE (lipoprotein component of BamABCDE complex)